MREEGKNGVHRTRAINWNSILKKKNNQHSDHEKQAQAHGNERHGYLIQASYSFSTGFYFIHKRTFLIPIPARSRTPLALSFSFTSTRCNLLVRGRNPLRVFVVDSRSRCSLFGGLCFFDAERVDVSHGVPQGAVNQPVPRQRRLPLELLAHHAHLKRGSAAAARVT